MVSCEADVEHLRYWKQEKESGQKLFGGFYLGVEGEQGIFFKNKHSETKVWKYLTNLQKRYFLVGLLNPAMCIQHISNAAGVNTQPCRLDLDLYKTHSLVGCIWICIKHTAL